MSRMMALGFLFTLLPLVGGLWKTRGIVFSALAGAIGLGACAFLSPSSAFLTAFLCQSLVLVLLSVILFTLSRKQASVQLRQKNDSSAVSLQALRERCVVLKEAVSKGDQDEARSLQIYGIAKMLAESLSWNEMAPRLSSGLQKLFGAFEFLLYSVDESGRWNPLQRRGTWAKEPPVTSLPSKETGMLHPPQIRETVPVLSIPIFTSVADDMNGVLFLKSSDENKTAEELVQTGREFAEQLGVAMKKALLFNQMEIHSRIDGLTGVLRRQPFMDRLQEELKRAAVFHTPFSLMMVDIDHFKAVNDTHGHPAGDAVLRRVGEILKDSVYETDVVGRYGGEEFIILLPRAEAEGVLRKAEALRQRFEREIIPSGFENLQITVSIGLAHFPEGGRTAEALISSTDKALYRAKETGRNRVVAA